MASCRWLLASAPVREQAKTDWETKGVAWLRPGLLYAAVTIPAGIIHAAVGVATVQECAEPLAEVLGEGPLFYEAQGFGSEDSYTALVLSWVAQIATPAGMVLHPPRALLQVPAPDVTEPNEGLFWVVPMNSPGLLVPFDRLVPLVTLGRERLGSQEVEVGE
ncbi:hypothetical protein [Streptomyces sp. H27-C3]|uniref:hypothetical protein n=1 Tax=Streptomyces sp. H27-C3 TaxID=3046305 RepID=UPI0024BB81C1|nr:hypothetical protein [Streptomyces sp. H27-C3]MDJ0460431.1 hypothetical protein [Streptomyces sp. H27-C3]